MCPGHALPYGEGVVRSVSGRRPGCNVKFLPGYGCDS